MGNIEVDRDLYLIERPLIGVCMTAVVSAKRRRADVTMGLLRLDHEFIAANRTNFVSFLGQELGNSAFGGNIQGVARVLARIRDFDKEERGLVLNFKENDMTAIMKAAYRGSTEMVKLLLWGKADIHSVNSQKRAAITLASINGNVGAMECLLHAGADKNHMDDSRRTPIFWTVMQGHQPATMMLIEKRVDLGIRGEGGKTVAGALLSRLSTASTWYGWHKNDIEKTERMYKLLESVRAPLE